MTVAQRKYRMTSVRAGSYLLPSNDGQTLWHIYSFEDGRSHGIDEPDRTWWACAYFPDTYDRAVASAERDVDDYGYIDHGNWRECDSHLPTRSAAIIQALDVDHCRPR